MTTIEDVKATCTYHHTAAYKRYVSRKEAGVVSDYKGKFGEGYTIDCPRWDTTNFCWREYWIKKD